MSLPERKTLLGYMSPTVSWDGCNPYGNFQAAIFVASLACTVYPRLTSGSTLIITGDDSATALSPSLPEQYAATPNESHLLLLSHTTTVPDSYPEVKDIGAYLSDKFKVYQVPASRLTIIQSQESSVKFYNTTFYRRFSSAIPRLFPWLFRQTPITPDELAYFRALSTSETNSDDLTRMEEAFYNKTDLSSKALDKAVESLFTGTIDRRKDTLKRQIEGYYQDLKEARSRISRIFADITQSNNELVGLDSKDESTFITELKDYLHAQKEVAVTANDNRLILTITTILSNYNPDDVNTFVLDADRPYNHYLDDETSDVRSLFKAIFVDRIFKVKMAAQYELDFNCHVTARSGKCRVKDNQAVPNPHINRHSCLGNYEPMLEDAEDNRDFLSAIAICQQSAGSMNLVETISSNYFFDDFATAYNNDIPVILTAAGESITPKQAIGQLKKGT